MQGTGNELLGTGIGLALRVVMGETGITWNSTHLRTALRRTSMLSSLGAHGTALLTSLWGALESSLRAGCAVLGAGITKGLAQKGH